MNIYGILTSENVDNMNEKILVDGVDIGNIRKSINFEFSSAEVGRLATVGKSNGSMIKSNIEEVLWLLSDNKPFVFVVGRLNPPHDKLLRQAIEDGKLYWAFGGYATEIKNDVLIGNGAIIPGSRLITSCRLTDVAITMNPVLKNQRVYINE